MRLFIFPFAPNVMRVDVVAREKEIDLDWVDISADLKSYLATNPMGQVPALETADGRILTESLTICQYLDNLSGSPFLFGSNDEERLHIAMWERRAETRLFNVGVEYGHHVHPMFAGSSVQFPDYAKTLLPKVEAAAEVFSDQIEKAKYVCGDRFTAADITACLGYIYLTSYGALKADEWPVLQRWSDEVLARKSMDNVRPMIDWFKTPS